jgi:hypothetical protein
VARNLDAATDITSGDVATNISVNPRPAVVVQYTVDSEGAIWVTTKYTVVTLVEDLGSKGFRDKNSTFVKDDVVFCRKVGISINSSFTPLGILMESVLEALE